MQRLDRADGEKPAPERTIALLKAVLDFHTRVRVVHTAATWHVGRAICLVFIVAQIHIVLISRFI